VTSFCLQVTTFEFGGCFLFFIFPELKILIFFCTFVPLFSIKRIIIDMKKLLLVLAAVGFFAVGCQTDNTSDNAVNVGDGTTLTISLPQTRTSLGGKVGDTYPIYWSEGDKIVVNGSLSEKVCIDVDDNSRAKFVVNPSPEYPYHITYPYCESTSAEQAVVEFPAEQVYTEGTFAPNCVPMCGYAEKKSKTIALKHLASVLRVPVKAKFDGAALEKVVLTAENSVAGEYNVDCQNAAITATESVGNVVTYTLPANFTLSSSTESVLHIVLPAVEIGACTIEFIEKGGEKMVATWTPSTSLSKGVVREFKTVTYAPKTTTVLTSFEAVADEFEIFYENIKGYVRYTDGSPIAGVAMSDGFQVVKTDVNGYYEMSGVTPETWYIYCSLPADVKVPIDDLGRPGFFQKYEVNKYQYDFEFEKLPNGPEEEFAIFAIADPQVNSSESTERFKLQASSEIKNYTTKIGMPCYGIALGDIISNTNGLREKLFVEIQEALSATNTGIPVFAVFGNHDNSDFNESNLVFPDERNSTFNLKIQRPFEEAFGPVNYSFNRGDAHIVTLRNTQYMYNYTPGGDYVEMKFTDRQYEWIEQDLALVPKNKMVIFCVHIPIFNSKNGAHVQDVLTLLNEFEEAHILSGHLHYRKCYDYTKATPQRNIFEQSITAAHATGWGDNVNLCCDGAPMGHEVLIVKNGAFTKWYHKGFPYGMNDENYQIRLHRGGDITGAAIPEGDANKNGTKGYYQFPYNSNTILANVFCSDPHTWTIEVWKYNKSTGNRTTKIGTMTSLESYAKTPTYDELVGSYTYEDPKRPDATVTDSGRDFWTIGALLGHLGLGLTGQYHECHTLWKYTLSDADAEADIMVVARDQFGNEYTETKFQEGTNIDYVIYDASLNGKSNSTVE